MSEETEAGEEKELSFTGVVAHAKDLIVVMAIVDEYAEDNQDHALLCLRDGDGWVTKGLENSIADLCVIEEPKRTVLCCGVDGEVEVASFPGWATEQVDPSEDGPSYSLHLKAIARIGKRAYATGMGRQVHRRDAPNKWSRVDSGVFVRRGDRKKSVGFNAIDGIDETHIIAVGYHGDIWSFNGKQWNQVESPTNVVLTRVRCLSERKAYACGQVGTILLSSGSGWRVLPQDLTEEDFWGLTSFRDKLWLSNGDGIFVLDDDVLRQVDLKQDDDVTTSYLGANKETIWSVGEKDILFSKDGKKWTRVDPPQFFE